MSNRTFDTQSALESFQPWCFCGPHFCQCKIGFNLHSMPRLFFMFVFATPQFEWFKTMLTLLCEWQNYPIKHSMPIPFLNPFKHVVFYSPFF